MLQRGRLARIHMKKSNKHIVHTYEAALQGCLWRGIVDHRNK